MAIRVVGHVNGGENRRRLGVERNKSWEYYGPVWERLASARECREEMAV